MSALPSRACAFPGCSKLNCKEHGRKRLYRELDKRRGTSNERGYDRDHQKLRILCFVRDGWKCVDCGWEPEIVTDFKRFELGTVPVDRVLDDLRRALNSGERHLHADHQIPIQVRPDLRLDLDNLKTRCDKCHNRKTMNELRASLKTFCSPTLF